MNLLFLTMSNLSDINERYLYADLMRCFRDSGHNVYIVSPRERRFGEPTGLIREHGVEILGVRTLNVQQSTVIEKGLGQVLIGPLFKRAIKHYFSEVKFDIVLYSTPPITLLKVVRFLKRRNPGALAYLLLKDVFPQNAVDIGMLSKTGLKGFIYRSFRRVEQRLYNISDYIGCMSPANVKYLLEHNTYINAAKVEVAPNSREVYENREYASVSDKNDSQVIRQREEVRLKYSLPLNVPLFIFGGNIGKPQGIPFFIKCLEANAHRNDCHFVVVGSGVEYPRMEQWYKTMRPSSVTLIKHLPKDEFSSLVKACDVGLVLLDFHFTVPNYPSRLLSYLMEKKPIIACTDLSSDIGTIASENGYGYWCPSNSVERFTQTVDKMLASDIELMGARGYEFFLKNYTVQNTYKAIVSHFK